MSNTPKTTFVTGESNGLRFAETPWPAKSGRTGSLTWHQNLHLETMSWGLEALMEDIRDIRISKNSETQSMD